MGLASEAKSQDGGGGYPAEFPARHASRPLSEIARELIAQADDAESRTGLADDVPYCRWRGRSLRMAAAIVYEVCGQPERAAAAIRGAHG